MWFKYKYKDVKVKKFKRNRVAFDEVEKIFELYCDDWTVTAISKELGISPLTIQRYIDYGNPNRAIEPLRLRRLRVYKRAAALKDDSLAERISENIEIAVKVFGDSGRRFVKRLAAVEMLEDTEGVLTPDELDVAAKIAYEPSTDDYVKFHRVSSEWVSMLNTPVQDGCKSILNVNVNQMQQQEAATEATNGGTTASSRVAIEGVEAVYKHLEAMSEASVDDHNKISVVVADVSETAELLADEEVV